MSGIYLSFALTAAIVSFTIMKRAHPAPWATQPTMPVMAYLAFLAAHLLPAMMFNNDPTMPRARAYLTACTIAIVLLPIGALYANLMLRFHRYETGRFYALAVTRKVTASDKAYLTILGILCGGILLLYISEVSVYPLKAMLIDGANTQAVNGMRLLASGQRMDSPYWYLFGIARVFLMPLLFVLVVVAWRDLRSPFTKLVAIGFLTVTAIYNSWSTAKTPVAVLFFLAGLTLLLQSNVDHGTLAAWRDRVVRVALRHRHRLWMGVACCVLLTIAYPMLVFELKSFGQAAGQWEVFYEGIFKRIFFKPAFLSYFQFEMFPHYYDHTHFADIQKFANVAGLEYVNLSRLTAITAFGAQLSNAPPAAVGNFYAQGGFPMVVIGSFLLGLLTQAAHIFAVRHLPRSRFALAFVAVLLLGGFRTSMQSFHSLILSETFVPLLVASMAWIVVRAVVRAPAGRSRQRYPGLTSA